MLVAGINETLHFIQQGGQFLYFIDDDQLVFPHRVAQTFRRGGETAEYFIVQQVDVTRLRKIMPQQSGFSGLPGGQQKQGFPLCEWLQIQSSGIHAMDSTTDLRAKFVAESTPSIPGRSNRPAAEATGDHEQMRN